METILAQPTTTARKWYEMMWQVWRHPGLATFRSISQEPHACWRGILWVAMAGFISGLFIYSFVTFFQNFPESTILGQLTPAIYYFTVIPSIAVIDLVFSVGITHWIAGVLDGNGRWEQLFLCYAAIRAPIQALSSLSFILMIYYPQWTLPISCGVLLIILALVIYEVVLYIRVIQAVENLGTGAALASFFSPWVIMGIIFIFVVILKSN